VFLTNVPADLNRYYEPDYYQFDSSGEPRWRSEPARARAAAYRVNLVRQHVPGGHLVEIGAGTGAFAVAAKAAGFTVSAIEMDQRCCHYLNEQGITAICSDRPLEALQALPPASAVTIWHVLEHLPNPGDVLQSAASKLEPGGLLALAVPNARSLQFRLMGRRWAHLDAPRHLCLIPPEALIKTAEQLGMRCVAITTNDPDGLACNLLGWFYGVQSRPAESSSPWFAGYLARSLTQALAPLERSGRRGAAITVAMCMPR
jgi:SAM-dependent methyltransferase